MKLFQFNETIILFFLGNHSFQIFLTGSPPNQLRFRILNADATFKVKLSVYYSTSQRLDLYKNNTFQNATNAVYINGAMTLQDPSTDLDTFMPNLTSPAGSNLYYKGDSKIHFTIDGSTFYDVKIAPVLFVKFGFPATTPSQFFSPATAIGNMALLLGVPASQIRSQKT